MPQQSLFQNIGQKFLRITLPTAKLYGFKILQVVHRIDLSQGSMRLGDVGASFSA